MTDTPHQQTVVVAQPAPPPRWIPMAGAIIGILGFVSVVAGLLMTIGAWRASVDASIADLKDRMKTAETNQKTYIPVLLGLTKDVSYLAERARREDERLDRERGERERL